VFFSCFYLALPFLPAHLLVAYSSAYLPLRCRTLYFFCVRVLRACSLYLRLYYRVRWYRLSLWLAPAALSTCAFYGSVPVPPPAHRSPIHTPPYSARATAGKRAAVPFATVLPGGRSCLLVNAAVCWGSFLRLVAVCVATMRRSASFNTLLLVWVLPYCILQALSLPPPYLAYRFSPSTALAFYAVYMHTAFAVACSLSRVTILCVPAASPSSAGRYRFPSAQR